MIWNQRQKFQYAETYLTGDAVQNVASTKSLASDRSREITFAAFVPWFQIQTQTLTNTLNHTITLTQSQTLTWPRNEAFSPD